MNADTELKGYIDALTTTANGLQEQLNTTNTKIDNLKTELQGEISTAKAEVLAQLDALRTELEGELAQITAAISALQAKDAELEKKITDLQNYVDTELSNTKDWAEATFATLEQYNALANEVATIKTQITAINTSIANLETRINEKISNDIAAAVATLNEDIQQKVKDITDAYTSAINTAKSEITAAYTAAIESAISTLESSMQSWVNEQLKGYYTITEIDALIATLTEEFNNKLDAQKAYLESLINALSEELKMLINSNSSAIEALRARVSNLENSTSVENANKIAENAAAIAANAQNISNNAQAISANSSNITANSSKIEVCKVNISKNAELIAENKSAIEALKSSTDTAIAKNAADIATNAEKIAKNAELIAKNAIAINNNAEAIAQNSEDIAKLQQELATTKTEITEAYKSAIATAISTLDGELRGEIATQVSTINTRIDNEIATVNATIDALTSRVATLESEVDAIQQQIADILQDIANMKDDITNLMKRIQSVTYIPKYSDGKACVKDGAVELDFQISPKSAVAEIAANWQSILSVKTVYTITRAVSFVDMPILSCDADTTNGVISIVASSENLSEEFFVGTQSANVALYLSDGNSEITSGYAPLVPYHPYNEIWYTTTNASVVTPHATDVFGANIISNTYENGKGVIRFDGAVTTIGEKSFYDCTTLTSITIPNTVTKIGEKAFLSCQSLASFYGKFASEDNLCLIVDGVLNSFAIGCGLSSYTIPDGIIEIGSAAFELCKSLTHIIISDSVTKIGRAAFWNCTSLTNVIIGNNVTEICPQAFWGCTTITDIMIPCSVTTIGFNAFGRCSSLTNVYFMSTVPPYFANQIFINAKDELRVYVPIESVDTYKTAWYEYADIIVAKPAENNQIHYLSSDEKVIIPNKTDVFGANIVSNTYENGKGVIIFDGDVTSIGSNAFDALENSDIGNRLVNISIPNTVTEIGYYSFCGCASLKSITIPDSVIKIGTYAFCDCTNLKDVIIPESVKSIDTGAFIACHSLTSITIPEGISKIEVDTFTECTGLTEITTPDSITKIAQYAFSSCSSLQSVTIGSSVTEIECHAFEMCTSLTSIYCKPITPPVMSRGYLPLDVFNSCSNLNKIYVPSSSVDNYKTAEYWKEFADKIVGYDF